MSIDVSTPNSPGWWFQQFANRMTLRNGTLDLLNRYLTGHAPLPEGADNVREAYESFQHMARLNLAKLIVDAPQQRMTVAGFRIGDAEGLSKEADRIWSYNELDTFSGDIHADMLGLRDGYATVRPDGPDGIPIITRENPFLMIADADPLRPTRIRAALKMLRDEFSGKDTAYLYLPGVVYKAQRGNGGPEVASLMRMTTDIAGFDWVSTEYWPRGYEDVVPVVRWHNKDGISEFEEHLDALNRINFTVLQELVDIAMQAYRQRAVKGDLPETDEHGVAIDYAPMFKPGAGALWMLPEGVELWESGTTDITPVLTAIKDAVRDVAIATGTPIYMLMPEGANQTAEGASLSREQLIYKAKDRVQRASFAWNQAMTLALRFSGVTANVVDMETLWEPVERLSLAERADAASKAGDVPWRTKMTDIWGFSPERVEEMEAERLADALSASLFLPPSPLAPTASPATPAVTTPAVPRGTQ